MSAALLGERLRIRNCLLHIPNYDKSSVFRFINALRNPWNYNGITGLIGFLLGIHTSITYCFADCYDTKIINILWEGISK